MAIGVTPTILRPSKNAEIHFGWPGDRALPTLRNLGRPATKPIAPNGGIAHPHISFIFAVKAVNSFGGSGAWITG